MKQFDMNLVPRLSNILPCENIRQNIAQKMSLCQNTKNSCLAEEYLSGIEITQSIIGDDIMTILPEVELVSDYPIRSYEVKYSPERSKHIIPARISDDVRMQIRRFGEKIYRGLGLRSCARIDYIIDNNKGPVVLEINTIPGMTETSLVPREAESLGISFADLCERIIDLSFKKYEDK